MTKEDAVQTLRLIEENNNAFYTELEILKKQNPQKKNINDIFDFQNIIKRLNERIDLIADMINNSEIQEAQISIIRLNEAIREFKAKSGKIDMGKVNDIILNYPISLGKLATTLNYESGEELTRAYLRDPIFVINTALMQFSMEWEADETSLQKFEGEGTVGFVERYDKILKIAEAKIKQSSSNPLIEEINLFDASHNMVEWAKTLLHEEIATIRTFILVMLIPKNISDEIEQLHNEYKQNMQNNENEYEKLEKLKKDYKKKDDELNEDYLARKKAKEKELAELDEDINSKDKEAQALSNRIEDYNKTLAEGKPMIEELARKHGRLIKEVEELENKKEEIKTKKAKKKDNDFEEPKEVIE